VTPTRKENVLSNKNLSSVAASVIDSYGNTARNVIGVYRAGGERMIGFVDQRFEGVVHRGAAGLRDGLRSNLVHTQQRWSGYCVKSLHYGSERATSAVDAAVDLAHKGVERIAANAERFDQATQLGALEAISRVAMPAAAVVSQFAERIESGSSKLMQRVSRQPAVASAVARQAKAAARQAKSVKQAATRSAGKRTGKGPGKGTATSPGKAVADKAAAQAAAAQKTVVRKAKAVVRKAQADGAAAAAA